MYLSFKEKFEIIIYFFLKFILNKIFMRQGGVLPAHLLKILDRNIFDDLSRDVTSGNTHIIIVTGTNGKTTASNLIAEGLKASGETVCANLNGANMPNGIFGAIMGGYGLNFRFNSKFLVAETDEKIFPYIVSRLKPEVIVVTNLYRDQLDRYGEVNTTVTEIKNAVKALRYNPFFVLPSYEPLASSIGYGLNNHALYYGFIENASQEQAAARPAKGAWNSSPLVPADAMACPNCGNILEYTGSAGNIFLLKFRCGKCGFQNPSPRISAGSAPGGYKTISDGDTGKSLSFKPSVEGDYNMANYLAAYAVLSKFNVPEAAIGNSFENFRTRYGRSYKGSYRGMEINVDLVKNPSGFNRVLEKIAGSGLKSVDALFAFSDRDADGRDVSWIWDVNFEPFVKIFGNIVITGLRPFDMAVRLKTAGIGKEKITVEHDMKKSLKYIAGIHERKKEERGNVFVLSTYTELANLRRYIS